MLMLGQRRRRWANIKPTLVQRLALAYASPPRHCSYIDMDINNILFIPGMHREALVNNKIHRKMVHEL